MPVDGPVGRDGAESPQISGFAAGAGEDRALDRRVEPVPWTDHRVPEAVSGHRKLHGHKLQVILPEPGYRRSMPIVIQEDALVRLLFQDSGQEVVDQDPLVMPSDLLADFLEADVLLPAQFIGDLVVEPQENGMQLRDDAVLVVAGITDKRPAVRPPGKLDRSRVEGIARHALAQKHVDPVFFIHVGLVVRPAPVQVVQVETGRSEIHQRLKLRLGRQGLTQLGSRVEGEVMVGELSEIGVGRRYARVLFGISLGLLSGRFGLFRRRDHYMGQPSRSACLNLAPGRSGNSLVKRPSITPSSGSAFLRSHHVPWRTNVDSGEGSPDQDAGL